DRGQVVEGGDDRARGDQGARADLAHAQHAGEGRAHHAVGQVGLDLPHLGAGAVAGGALRIERGARDQLAVGQLLLAAQHALGLVVRRAGGGERRLLLLAAERHQRRAGRDVVATFEVHAVHDLAHLGGDLDRFPRLHRAQRADAVVEGLHGQRGGGHHHGRRARGAAGRALLAAARQHQGDEGGTAGQERTAGGHCSSGHRDGAWGGIRRFYRPRVSRTCAKRPAAAVRGGWRAGPFRRNLAVRARPARPFPQHRTTPMIHESILDTIGRTPVVRLHRVAPAGVTLYAKVEAFNPGGSVKDRLALAIILDAEARGLLKPGDTVVEATSGNTGVALAMICAARGYRFVATMAETFSVERRKLMRAYGAKVILTPAAERGSGMVRKARELAEEHGWFLASQFANPANPAWHRNTTAAEILQDFAGRRLDHFGTGWGPGGALSGAGEMLEVARPEVGVVAAEAAVAALLQGADFTPHKIQGWTPDFVPEVLNREVADRVLSVADDVAIAT